MPPTAPQPNIRQALGGVATLVLLVIAIAGIIYSFSGLQQLATECGIPHNLAWLLPVTIDAASLGAARIWLLPTVSAEVRQWARQWMFVAIGLSIGGNVVERAIAAHLLVLPWWAVVVVGAVPPAMLATVVHLASLVITARQEEAAPQQPIRATWVPSTTAPATTYQVTNQPAPATIQPPVQYQPAIQPPQPAVDTEFDALMHQARALRAAEPTIGRNRLAAALDCGDHTARRILAQWRQEAAA